MLWSRRERIAHIDGSALSFVCSDSQVREFLGTLRTSMPLEVVATAMAVAVVASPQPPKLTWWCVGYQDAMVYPQRECGERSTYGTALKDDASHRSSRELQRGSTSSRLQARSGTVVSLWHVLSAHKSCVPRPATNWPEKPPETREGPASNGNGMNPESHRSMSCALRCPTTATIGAGLELQRHN